MNVSGTAYALSGAGGTVDVSTQGITGNFTIDSATDADTQGFVLSGFVLRRGGGTSASFGGQ